MLKTNAECLQLQTLLQITISKYRLTDWHTSYTVSSHCKSVIKKVLEYSTCTNNNKYLTLSLP